MHESKSSALQLLSPGNSPPKLVIIRLSVFRLGFSNYFSCPLAQLVAAVNPRLSALHYTDDTIIDVPVTFS